ncbi:MAG TPA: NAD(P)/FAD-dependent oxidoreductase [Solirubrobacteraceae bacterium]|jgi:cation diffusion facilitator CzcD-associated flavoprotein CzcO
MSASTTQTLSTGRHADPDDGLSTPHHRVAIVGSGFAGLGTAIRLKQRGEHDFVLLERAERLGGTWRDNTYPGCACDVPSHLYSFSFALNPDWTRLCSPQAEIQAYLERVAEEYGIPPHIRFGHEMLESAWNDERRHWEIQTSAGSLTADLLVSGMGGLSEPSVPKLEGLESFEGAAFHSAQWDHSHDLSGKRVAVIGTGASAVQFIPEIQPEVGELQVYQRTAPWIVPRRNAEINPRLRRLFQRFPPAMKLLRGALYWSAELLVLGLAKEPRLMRILERVAEANLRRQVLDPELRSRLAPSYRLGCKRILFTDSYLPALNNPNVDVVSSGIREVRPHSIVTEDGVEREVDTIIFGTGFHVTDQPLIDRVRGTDGRLLSEHWRGTMAAFNGTTVTGFPNLFTLLGPYTGLGHTSIVIMIEAQIEYVMKALDAIEDRGVAAVDVRPRAQAAFVAEMSRMAEGTVWTAGGCQSWYLDAHGNASTIWPDFTFRFRARTKRFDTDDYELIPHVTPRVDSPIRATTSEEASIA